MNSTVIIIIFFVVAIVGILVIPRFLVKRAINQVVDIFLKNEAIDVASARTITELRLQKKGYLERMVRTRDYKPYALEMLLRADIVIRTEDDKLYISKEMVESKLNKKVSTL